MQQSRKRETKGEGARLRSRLPVWNSVPGCVAVSSSGPEKILSVCLCH